MSKDAQIVLENIKGVVKYFINVESAMEVYIMITYVQQHNLQYRNNPFWNRNITYHHLEYLAMCLGECLPNGKFVLLGQPHVRYLFVSRVMDLDLQCLRWATSGMAGESRILRRESGA